MEWVLFGVGDLVAMDNLIFKFILQNPLLNNNWNTDPFLKYMLLLYPLFYSQSLSNKEIHTHK